MPAKKSSATLSTLHEKLTDAEFVSASFKQTGVSEPFLVTGTFERIENAYGKQRNDRIGGRTTIGIDSWYVVLSQLTTYSHPCEAKDAKS